MDTVFEDWKKTLADFKKDVEKDLAEIRRHKREVQKMREQMEAEYNVGHIINDPDRIILSAPEIIIGNVDASGELKSDSQCNVIIKGRSVKVQGIGNGGEVVTNASSIIQRAINPGSDGEEEVVESVSQIITQANTVLIQANDDDNVFTSLTGAIKGGVTVHADTSLVLDASMESDSKKKRLEKYISELEKSKSDIKGEAESSQNIFESLIKQMKDLLEKHNSLLQDEISARADLGEVFELNEKRRSLTTNLYAAFYQYSKSLSQLAEFNRQISQLKKQKDEVIDSAKYTKNSTGATIKITGEKVDIISQDGEGNLRDNTGSGINIQGNSILLTATEKDDSLKENGRIELRSMNVALTANDSKNVEIDDNGDLTKGDFDSKGEILLQSKNIKLEAVDYQAKDKKEEEKSLAKEGKLSMRFETVDISTNDTEGKSVGSLNINAKSIGIKSMDQDKDNGSDKSLTTGSTMVLLSEKMFIGSKDKDTESKLVQTSSETIGTFAKKTFEIQQGEKKSILQMDSGKMSVSGDTTDIYGKTTINDATEVKGEIKAPKASIDSVEARNDFKSPNISDGMAAGGGGGGGSLSAKLNKEDVPKTESGNN